MKATAVYALHYGVEYLPWSIRSIQDAVDEIIICYTEKPSYGHGRGIPCPESEAELQEAAHRFATKPIRWHKGHWQNEGHHRQATMTLSQKVGADVALVVDADELWPPGMARACLEHVYRENRAGRWLARFEHFWRSLHWSLFDGFVPIRVIDFRHSLDIDAHLGEAQTSPVLHYGYAQSLPIMQYKWTCHGHQAELRPGWYEQKFQAWTPQRATEVLDLHPVVIDLWGAAVHASESTEAITRALLYDHPNFEKELIA